jgi:serine/threonine protein kinase
MNPKTDDSSTVNKMDEPANPSVEWFPQLVGDYYLRQICGRGKYGSVFRAVHRQNKNVVRAIKMINISQNTRRFQRNFRIRVENESRVLQALPRHPQLPRFYELHIFTAQPPQTDGPDTFAALVMEYVNGIRLSKIDPERHVYFNPRRVAHELLAATAAIHDRNIAHQDLKPDNLLLTRNGTLKVLDFGLACLQTDIEQETFAPRGGTPQYQPPEWGAVKTHSSFLARTQHDDWSVGIILYELMHRHLPSFFHAKNTVAQLRHLVTTYPIVSQCGDTYFDLLIDGLLAIEPCCRWTVYEGLVFFERHVLMHPPGKTNANRIHPPMNNSLPSDEELATLLTRRGSPESIALAHALARLRFETLNCDTLAWIKRISGIPDQKHLSSKQIFQHIYDRVDTDTRELSRRHCRKIASLIRRLAQHIVGAKDNHVAIRNELCRCLEEIPAHLLPIAGLIAARYPIDRKIHPELFRVEREIFVSVIGLLMKR